MKRIAIRLGGLALAGLWAAVIPAQGADEVRSLGTGPAYEAIGKVAVMHEGRVKPLDTVAREEIKQVYHRETMKLRGLNDEIEAIVEPQSHAKKSDAGSRVEKWGPVGAFIGWTISPEYWDDQPFILVDYLPLRRRIVAETLTSRLNAIADKPTTAEDEKAPLRKLAAGQETTALELTSFIRGSKLPI